jgi:hypothetical protein
MPGGKEGGGRGGVLERRGAAGEGERWGRWEGGREAEAEARRRVREGLDGRREGGRLTYFLITRKKCMCVAMSKDVFSVIY